MPQLGIVVTTNEAAVTGGASVGTGTAFMVGQADQGPVGVAVLCQSFTKFISTFGTRSSTSAELYDAAETFFQEQGGLLYVSREEGSSMLSDPASYTASLTLDDAASSAAVVVSFLTPGADGNNYEVQVETADADTFTATLADSSTTMSAISDFTNIGVGTPVSGTGVTSGTTISSVDVDAGTAVLSTATTAEAAGTDIVITPTQFTVLITDPTDDPSTTLEEWGPFATTAELFEVVSAYVSFAISGSNHHQPASLEATALSGGADDSGDVSDNTVATALTFFLPNLGPGQVSAPGQTDVTIHAALAEHAIANNRVACLDVADNSSADTVIADLGALVDTSYCIVTEGSGIIPGLVAGTTRNVAASAIVSALCAQVDASGNPNQAPCGVDFPLQYVIGFTENFQLSDIQLMNAAGINTFDTINGILCLYGFSTPVSDSVDPIFWQANHARLRMALVDLFKQVAQPYMFKQIDGQGVLLGNFGAALSAQLTALYGEGALYGDTAADAFSVDVSSAVNTVDNLSDGIIGAAVSVHMSPFAQQVKLVLTAVPITQSL
jgi:hypothetical protein